MIVQIDYDLNSPGQNYNAVSDKIKSIANGWAKPLDSCWLIVTNLSLTQVRDTVRTAMDTNDSILVTQFNPHNYSAWMSKKVLDWIKQHEHEARV